MTDETVNKASGWNKTHENNNYRCVDLGERTKRNWRETQSLEPYYKRIWTENKHGQNGDRIPRNLHTNIRIKADTMVGQICSGNETK